MIALVLIILAGLIGLGILLQLVAGVWLAVAVLFLAVAALLSSGRLNLP